MKQPQNPFTTLYVTERMEEDKFPSLFSTVLVPQVLPLFQDGNVVVRGTQGTGKSMLLALLRTEIRLAFDANTQHEYPVSDELCHFVSAEINLATNQALRFANRWGKAPSDAALVDLQVSFIDYVNTWLLRDLLRSIRVLSQRDGIWRRYDLGATSPNLNDTVRTLGDEPSLASTFHTPRDFDEAYNQLSKRIQTYLLFLNGKLRSLPTEIRGHQSQSIGQPLAIAVRRLREIGCLAEATRVLVTMDQFEQLLDFEAQLSARHFDLLRQAVDEAIHLREPTICYRIGTRPHAWRHPRSESLRDYFPLDLDELLRRREHTRARLFPMLADDVLRRRLRCFGYSEYAERSDPLIEVFGRSPSPRVRAKRLAQKANWSRLVRIPKTFPSDVSALLRRLSATDPLSAQLGVAWVNQHIAQKASGRKPSGPLPTSEMLPWEQPNKRWWKKERLGLAVLQMATGFGQRVPMFGKADVLNLSGSNILIFGSICQHIWASWIRAIDTHNGRFPVAPDLQDEAIRDASREWHHKIAEEPWIGDSLTQFVNVMGNYLHVKLKDDEAMSYPGGNGISLTEKDLQEFPEVEQILLDGTDRGFLLERHHTPKSRMRGPSWKWYLHPVLSPYFEITVGHTKEPRYVRGVLVREWMEDAGIVLPSARAKDVGGRNRRQPTLPGFERDE